MAIETPVQQYPKQESAAAMLGVNTSTLGRWVREAGLPERPEGTRERYFSSDELVHLSIQHGIPVRRTAARLSNHFIEELADHDDLRAKAIDDVNRVIDGYFEIFRPDRVARVGEVLDSLEAAFGKDALRALRTALAQRRVEDAPEL